MCYADAYGFHEQEELVRMLIHTTYAPWWTQMVAIFVCSQPLFVPPRRPCTFSPLTSSQTFVGLEAMLHLEQGFVVIVRNESLDS